MLIVYELCRYFHRHINKLKVKYSSLSLQHRASQPNQFKVGMKLEIEDPKQDSTVSIATVITVLGPRVRLRFDGCNKPEDVWQLVDSDKIHPVGWCEGNGGVLKQPTGKDSTKISRKLD